MNYPETIVVVRAPLANDIYGSPVRDWDEATETTVVGVQVQPSTSDEPVEVGRTPVVTHMRVLTPIGTDLDLLPSDRVEWSGDTWTVEGEVARFKRPTDGTVHHVEAMLKRVQG